MVKADLPPELVGPDQWICWRSECRNEDCGIVLDPSVKTCPDCGEKTTKRPIDPSTGRHARTDDPSTWASIDGAIGFDRESDTHGVGFVFSDDDPIVGIDIDDCRDVETGDVDDWAIDIVTHLNSFAEVSPSGTGIHVYVLGQTPDGRNRKDGVEIYDERRYFTVTGDEIPQSYGHVGYRQDELESVHEGHVESTGGWTGGEIEPIDVDLGDVDVTEGQETYENDLGETLTEHREKDAELDAALEEIEPEYDIADDSPSGYDLSVVAKLWKRRFSATQIATILYQYRHRPKLDEHDTYIERTIAAGAGGDRFDPRGLGDVEILDDRDRYDSIEEADLPTDRHFVLDKPPREGGSHASIAHLCRRPLVVLASRHAICEHHIDILEDVLPDGKSAVHYEGSARACESGGGDCPRVLGKDGDYYERLKVETEAKDAVHANRVVTGADCPEHFCPHQFLKLAAKHAYAVVTVPNLLSDLDESRGLSGNNILIDEEQALSYFRPPSVTLAEIEQAYEPDGTRTIQTVSSAISTQLDTLEEIRSHIHQRWVDEGIDGLGTRGSRDIEEDVIPAIEFLEDVADSIAVSEIAADMDDPSLSDVVGEITERTDDIEAPEPRLTPENFRQNMEDYAEQYYFDDSSDPGAMVECVLFGYDDRHFDWKYTGSSYKLRMVGGRDVFHPDALAEANQIGVIAGPEGELFFDDLGFDAETILIEEFRYDDDFVVAPVGQQIDSERMEPTGDQRDRARRVSKLLNTRAHPHLAVTGTKGRAKAHHAWLDRGTADIIASPESPAKDSYSTWSVGGSAIIYENSAVSRGVDVPFFDVSVVASSGFATPYWEARKKHYAGEDDDEYEHARAVEHQLKAHELTNAVLRPAPTRHVDEYSGTKFIVCADWDVTRLRYLRDRALPTFGTSESAANFVENLTIGGALREDIGDVYQMLDGSEGKFIKAAMEAPFSEADDDRPTYDLDDLAGWAEQRYFHRQGTVDEVEQAVPPRGEVETSYLTDLFSGWNGARVVNALKTLNKIGHINLRKEYPDDGGKPKRYWSKEIPDDS